MFAEIIIKLPCRGVRGRGDELLEMKCPNTSKLRRVGTDIEHYHQQEVEMMEGK